VFRVSPGGTRTGGAGGRLTARADLGYPPQPLGPALDSLSSTRIAQNRQSSSARKSRKLRLFPIADPPDDGDPQSVVPQEQDPPRCGHEAILASGERELLGELLERVRDVVHRASGELDLAEANAYGGFVGLVGQVTIGDEVADARRRPAYESSARPDGVAAFGRLPRLLSERVVMNQLASAICRYSSCSCDRMRRPPVRFPLKSASAKVW